MKKVTKKPYTFSCTQKDGSTYTAKLQGFSRLQASERMREAKAIFTGCDNFKLVKLKPL